MRARLTWGVWPGEVRWATVRPARCLSRARKAGLDEGWPPKASTAVAAQSRAAGQRWASKAATTAPSRAGSWSATSGVRLSKT